MVCGVWCIARLYGCVIQVCIWVAYSGVSGRTMHGALVQEITWRYVMDKVSELLVRLALLDAKAKVIAYEKQWVRQDVLVTEHLAKAKSVVG